MMVMMMMAAKTMMPVMMRMRMPHHAKLQGVVALRSLDLLEPAWPLRFPVFYRIHHVTSKAIGTCLVPVAVNR